VLYVFFSITEMLRLPPRCKSDLRSSEMLPSVDR